MLKPLGTQLLQFPTNVCTHDYTRVHHLQPLKETSSLFVASSPSQFIISLQHSNALNSHLKNLPPLYPLTDDIF